MWSHVVGVPVYLYSEPERSVLTGGNTVPPQGITLYHAVLACTSMMVVVRCMAFLTTDVQLETMPPSQTLDGESKDHDVPSW